MMVFSKSRSAIRFGMVVTILNIAKGPATFTLNDPSHKISGTLPVAVTGGWSSIISVYL